MGLLPDTKPLASNYGEELENVAPVADPKREIGAEVLNPMRHDLAYVARMSFRLAIVLSASAVVQAVYGPEGVAAAQIATVDNADGNHDIDWSATGISGYAVILPLGLGHPYVTARTLTSLSHQTLDSAGGALADETLLLVL